MSTADTNFATKKNSNKLLFSFICVTSHTHTHTHTHNAIKYGVCGMRCFIQKQGQILPKQLLKTFFHPKGVFYLLHYFFKLNTF